MSELAVEIWSDVACPWCYIGKRRFESALAEFEHRDRIRVRWRSFELDAAAPRVCDPKVSYVARLAAKYGVEEAEAQSMIDDVVEAAAEQGIAMRFDRARSGNTFDAHRLVHLAATTGRADAMKERLFRAYFCDGIAVGDPAALLPLAVEVGLDESAARDLLAGDAFATDVRADEELALRLRIRSVPCFVLGGRRAVAGAHPKAAMLEFLRESFPGPSDA